jgi:HD-GYP domain-containing protein (c-di-GMP phosphodiesterase class II)
VFNVLEDLVTTVDNKDHYTRRHSDDVCERAMVLAAAVGLSHETQRVLRIAGLLHDIGKIGVPDGMLREPGSLDENEFEAVKQHVVLGKLITK